MANLSISADYYNWKIENEVDTASTDQLLLAEYYCRNGLPNGSSATCQNVADWVVRDSAGNLSSLYTPKMNVARQNLQAVTVGFKYLQDIGRFGSLQFSGNYTNMLKREVQAQPGEDFGTCWATRSRCGTTTATPRSVPTRRWPVAGQVDHHAVRELHRPHPELPGRPERLRVHPRRIGLQGRQVGFVHHLQPERELPCAG